MKAFAIIALIAVAGCSKDDDVQTVTKDMKVCRDGGGKPTMSTDMFGNRGLHIVCWPKEM